MIDSSDVFDVDPLLFDPDLLELQADSNGAVAPAAARAPARPRKPRRFRLTPVEEIDGVGGIRLPPALFDIRHLMSDVER